MPDAPGPPASPGSPGTPAQWVWLARIRRPQGRKGEVFAEILTDFPEKFAERRQLWLLHEALPGSPEQHAPASGRPADSPSPRQVELISNWLHKGGVVLHFEGVDSISEAEKLAGLIVALPREQRAQLAGDEVYISDVIGCALVDLAKPDAPVLVGEIEDVERDAGPVPILLVQGDKGEVLIPFARDYLRRIDLEGRRVEMALPEGLVDLNAGIGL